MSTLGRILRSTKDKPFAIIHDILVFPWEKVPEYVAPADEAILSKEIKRVIEFSTSSMNPFEVINKISKYRGIYTRGGFNEKN